MGDWLQMGRLKKEKSISNVFRFYIGIFILFISGEFLFLNVLFLLGIQTKFIMPANYYEQIIEKNRCEIESVDLNAISKLIPETCVYSIYDSQGNVLETNKNYDFAQRMWEISSENSTYGQGYYYKVITRDNNEICITGYKLEAFFNNNFIDKYFPNPTLCFIILFLLIFFVNVILISKRFSKRLSNELQILNETTHNISMENLEFDIKYSNIKEINTVLYALDKMKKHLNDSLKIQWNIEEVRNSQIGDLAHDIKTPLTIIKGNSELLREMNLSEEQSLFNDEIIGQVSTIENYIKVLLEIMNSKKHISLDKKPTSTKKFIDDIINTTKSLVVVKKINLEAAIEQLPELINIDYVMFKRALINIISNAVDFTPEKNDKAISSS